ncbi:hypothetical protein MACK_001829 [Theileria orientalis]|uniref:Uncharacterized protein n=1 Tax=Theileria orientalis TaxID=68886 RepID=A0A976MAR9_THEOR|nr:hypothetical protein MACK_001829 [Theileria orientalis]
MLDSTLKHLRETHPEESRFLESLSAIEERLDLLISRQQNCIFYDPGSQLSKIRLRIYNTYSDQNKLNSNALFSHIPPSRYTLFIKAYELDSSNKVVETKNVGLLTKYFRTILIDTPSGVVIWDRDEVLGQKSQIFNQNTKNNTSGSSSGFNYGSYNPYVSSSNSFMTQSACNPDFNAFDTSEVTHNIYNGLDELHINRLGFEECDVFIYFFPTQVLPVYSLSKQLLEFVISNSQEKDPRMGNAQANLPKITRSIWTYAFKKRLFVEEGDEVLLNLDENLRYLLKTDSKQVNICQIPVLLKPHLMPPLPLKVVHRVKLKGTPKDNERVFDVTLHSSFNSSYRSHDGPTDLDGQIASAENEVIELLHLRNIYSTFATDPHKFISSYIENRNIQNFKPFVPGKLDQKENYFEPWVHYAIENYLYSNNRTVNDFISRIMEKSDDHSKK